MIRPSNLLNWKDVPDPSCRPYPGDTELLCVTTHLTPRVGLYRFAVSHELLPPGRRTSYPHAELAEDEFVYVLEGTPDLWQDGHLHRLAEGDAVGWPAGTGIAHTIINNTETDVRLLVVGEASRRRFKVHYPLHPKRNAELGEQWWSDAPARPLGPYDALSSPRRPS
jgi:uncharacterized cupin superfamily protein